MVTAINPRVNDQTPAGAEAVLEAAERAASSGREGYGQTVEVAIPGSKRWRLGVRAEALMSPPLRDEPYRYTFSHIHIAGVPDYFSTAITRDEALSALGGLIPARVWAALRAYGERVAANERSAAEFRRTYRATPRSVKDEVKDHEPVASKYPGGKVT